MQRFFAATLRASGLELGGRLLRVGGVVLLARALGVEQFGIISSLLASAGLLVVLADLGITNYLASIEVSERREIDIARLFIIKLALLGAFGVLLVVAARYVESARLPFVILGVSVALSSLLDTVFAYARRAHRFVLEGWGRFVASLSLLVLVLAFWPGFMTARALTLTALVYLLAALLPLVWLLVQLRTPLHRFAVLVIRGGAAWRGWGRLAWAALPLGIAGIFGVIYNSLDAAMLGWFGMYHDAGWYGAAVRAASLVAILGAVLVRNTLPLFSKQYHAGQMSELARTMGRSLLTLALVGLPVVMTSALLAKPLFGYVFGIEYLASAQLFVVLVIGAVANWLVLQRMFLAIAENKRWYVAWITIISALVNAAGNALFIPRWGAWAAALTTVAAYLFMWIMYGVLQRKQPIVFALGRLARRGLLAWFGITALLVIGLLIPLPDTVLGFTAKALWVCGMGVLYIKQSLLPLWNESE